MSRDVKYIGMERAQGSDCDRRKQYQWEADDVLAQREMEKRRSPLVHRFRPFGAGIF